MDFNLKINADKSEMVVYNGSARPQIRVGGEALKNANTFKYLGYIADKRMTGRKHLKDRCLKMKCPAGFLAGVLRSLRSVGLEKKIQW